jgi:opacity protein-like surface antigen
MRRFLAAAFGVMSLMLVVGCAEVEDDSSATSSSGDCGVTATDDCTPKVGPRGKVRVDALTYRLVSASRSSTIGDPNVFGEKANGVYVILTIKVKSNKDESATLTDSVFKLEVNGNTYDPDNAGTVAAVGNGQEPFFLETIGPDSSLQGKVVFDVPKRVLRRGPLVRIGELGFGSTHAYIAIPSL